MSRGGVPQQYQPKGQPTLSAESGDKATRSPPQRDPFPYYQGSSLTIFSRRILTGSRARGAGHPSGFRPGTYGGGSERCGYFAFCETVTVCFAMVSVPSRAEPVFAATLNRTVPSPLSVGAVVMVIHVGALLTAVQAQPIGPFTVTDSLFDAPELIENVNGLTVRLHSTPA